VRRHDAAFPCTRPSLKLRRGKRADVSEHSRTSYAARPCTVPKRGHVPTCPRTPNGHQSETWPRREEGELLHETLDEEKETDEKLTELAESGINVEAADEETEEEEV